MLELSRCHTGRAWAGSCYYCGRSFFSLSDRPVKEVRHCRRLVCCRLFCVSFLPVTKKDNNPGRGLLRLTLRLRWSQFSAVPYPLTLPCAGWAHEGLVGEDQRIGTVSRCFYLRQARCSRKMRGPDYVSLSGPTRLPCLPMSCPISFCTCCWFSKQAILPKALLWFCDQMLLFNFEKVKVLPNLQ